ncbi:hypothetical protein VSDG_06053 [Cytospora chrysosperma]|uniref:Copper transport protein n=1 Tax=Cytospora chrysosperma TaxID=252740 RepID=A0A423VWF8_CYTCH|nr:hypothetical protein VSDG_06053 [Valsa sordida]
MVVLPGHGTIGARAMDMSSGMDMDMDMDMGSGATTTTSSSSHMSTAMSTMMVSFQNSMSTTLYSEAWTPSGAGAYAGTCIFLIALAATLRALFALRSLQEGRWLDRELDRRYVVVAGRPAMRDSVERDSLKQTMVLSANGLEEEVMVVRKRNSCARPWRLSVDPVRAVIDTVIAGVGYLLMLAVMTMNVGYFVSILGGTFLGSLAIGRYAVLSEH